jgi:hypothetical protein
MKSALIGMATMGLALIGLCSATSTVSAAPLLIQSPGLEQRPLLDAQYDPKSPTFRRCMRAKYGPRYFSRVPRAHRWHMAQACMG